MLWLDEIIQDYCSKERLKDLRVPFSFDGFAYATDGHRFIRIPVGRLANQYQIDSKKACVIDSFIADPGVPKKVYPTNLLAGLVAQIPKHPEYGDCYQCDGDGTVECPTCGQPHDCNECDGSGHSKEVVGFHFDGATVVLSGLAFNPIYIKGLASTAQILACPEIKFWPRADQTPGAVFEMAGIIVGILTREATNPRLIFNADNYHLAAV